jgi:hypothetical protein
MIQVMELAKTVHALDCTATAISNFIIIISGIKYDIRLPLPFSSEEASEVKFSFFKRLKATAET